jgi:hypothetical protein
MMREERMTKQIRLTALALISAIGVGFLAPAAAQAGSKGRRNTAIALGAVAVYGIVKKKPLVAGLAGGGAIYSYMRSREAARKERNRRRYRSRAYYKRHAYCGRHRSHYCRH